MSRDLETEHLTSRKTEPDHGPARHPAERSHDPQKSHPTSYTGLRRVAEAPPKGSPATAAAAAQHDKAESASFDGIRAALAYGAASIHGRATAIHTLIRSPGEAGPVGALDIIRKIFESVGIDLQRLSIETSTQAPNTMRLQLAHEAQGLAGAFERFSDACERARTYATEHHENFEKNPAWFKQYVESIYGHIGLDKSAASDRSVDTRKDDEILKETIRANLTAAGECVRAVRMGMAAGGSKVEEDTKKLIGHLRELDAVFGQSHDPAVTRSFKKQLGEMLPRVHALQSQSASQPVIAGLIKNGDVSRMIERLDGKTR